VAVEAALLNDEKDRVDRPWVPASSKGTACRRALERGLANPVAEFLSRPSKRFRARLVSCGARLAAREARGTDVANLALGTEAIELLHAGSLIVDDVQDGSSTRRGRAAFHTLHGTPLAVCGGNWLYFRSLSLLTELRLAPDDTLDISRMFTHAAEEAHEGQALDLSLRPDELTPDEVIELATALIELKTGSIAALALGLGAKLAGASQAAVAATQRFGRSFGLTLQVLDDFGNLLASPDAEKAGEDLNRNRLSGVWLHAALWTRGAVYEEFVATTRRLRAATPSDRHELARWLEQHGVTTKARSTVRKSLSSALHTLAQELGLPPEHEALRDLRDVTEAMTHAYV